MRFAPASLFAFAVLAASPVYAADAAPAPAPASGPYAQFAYLTGNCWQGTLPNKDVDQHCFRWVYGDKFVRDVHVVKGAGHPDFIGESIYYYDSVNKQLRYLYVENSGGTSSGEVTAADGVLSFPDATYQEGGQTQTYRSHWTRSGDNAYDVVTEFKKGDGWAPGWTAHMAKLGKPK